MLAHFLDKNVYFIALKHFHDVTNSRNFMHVERQCWAIDKFFFSLEVLTFTTHHKQLCGVRYVLHPTNTNASVG